MKARPLAFAGMCRRKGHFVDVNRMVPNQKHQKKKAPDASHRAGGMQKGDLCLPPKHPPGAQGL